MKKTLAIILALALVFSSFTFAFAEETLPADAKACAGLGMLVGAGNGVTLDYLKTAPTRIQAAIMVLRLKGLEADAKAFTGTANFADANTAAWAAPIMAYLKANPALGFAGTGGVNFEPNKAIDAKSYYKVMLETLGYKQNTAEVIGDFTFDKTFEFAATKGLTKISSVLSFTVNDLATATVEALKATIKGSTKTLAASLVEAKVITEAAAIAAGVYSPVPVVLAVESVTTDNLKQLTVKFNKEIKAAGDEDSYSVETDGDVVLDKDSDFALQADKKTVIITLTHDAAQQEEIELTVEDITAVDGSVLAKTVVKDIELFDKTIPSVLGAKVIGNDTIKVTFSEPMATTGADRFLDSDDFEVDGGDYIVKDVKASNAAGTEFNVNLYSTLENGKITVEVGTGVQDYAGYGTAKKTFELTVVEDTTAPVVVGFKDAKPNTVTLIFNEDIQFVDYEDSSVIDDVTVLDDKFYHTNTSNDATSVEIEGNELTLKFADEDVELPAGTAYIYVAKEMVADLWDNENAKIAQTVEITLDKTAPTVTKIEAGDTEKMLEITFSEEMDLESVTDADNYTILDKAGKEKVNVILSVDLNADADKVTVTFTEKMAGDYSVVISGVEDLAGNAIVKVTKAFNISDVTAPDFGDFRAKLYNIGTDDQMLRISFGEAMAITGRYSVLDLEKYTFGTTNLEDVEDATIKAVDGNKAVEIELPYVSTEANTHFATTNPLVIESLSIARVADAAGNYTDDLSVTLDTTQVSGEGTIAIEKADSDYTARLTSEKTIVITLVERLTKFAAADFVIMGGTTELKPATVRHTINEDGMSTVTFTLATDVNTNATYGVAEDAITVTTKSTTTSANAYGEKLATGDTVTLIDKAKPILKIAEFTDSHTITLTFSEALEIDTFAATSKNGFSVAGGTLSTAELNLSNPTQVILKSTGTTVFTVNTNVYYNSVAGLKDMFTISNTKGNSIADFSEVDKLEE
jgi:hypothetical protein